MSLRQLHEPTSGLPLDLGLVVIFPGPQTATGEDLAELHLHGGVAVVEDVLNALVSQPGVRLAEAGEFTRRAFVNHRLDLAQVEGLADLIAAETSSQRTQALALAGGALSTLADSWRMRILAILAQAEAGLDFSEDEADVSERIAEATTAVLLDLAAELDGLLTDAKRAAHIRDGLTVVVTGAPNVGKSSIVNALAMRDVSIVTPIAGTTRDLVEVALDLDGVSVTLIDTAGLRDTEDPIEQEGVRRARARAANADLVLLVVETNDMNPCDQVGTWLVCNKVDLEAERPRANHYVSAKTGEGLRVLREALRCWAHDIVRPGEPALIANIRHRTAFLEATVAVRAAAAAQNDVLRAEDLRRGAHALGRITGRIGVEDVLDLIFSQFCIGK
jgi:tRNA modification GTPase